MHQDFLPGKFKDPQGSSSKERHLGMEDEKVSFMLEYYYGEHSHHTDHSCIASVASLLTYLLSNQKKPHPIISHIHAFTVY